MPGGGTRSRGLCRASGDWNRNLMRMNGTDGV